MHTLSAAIIGGADGPVTVFLAGSPVPLIITALVIAAAATAAVILIRRKRR